MAKTILMIGGTKFIGKRLVEKFINRGDLVYIFSRTKTSNPNPRVKSLQGDRDIPNDLVKLKEFIRDCAFDSVYDMCCYNEKQAIDMADCIGSQTKQIVLFSSAAVYAPSEYFPLTEKSQLGHHPSFGDYGIDKLKAEKVYTEACYKTDTKLTIFRPHYIIGRNDYFKRHNYFINRLQKGDVIEVPGNGSALIQLAYAEDVVDSFFNVPFLQADDVDILNISSDELMTLNGLVLIFSKALDIDPNIVNVDYASKGLDEKHFYEGGFPFPNLNLVLSDEKIKEKYGITHTSIDNYMQELLQDRIIQ